MASGDTKTNQYLDIAANGTRADLPTGTCCETRTQTLIRGVAERVMDIEDEVERLENNPDVVDIVATYQDLQDYDTSGLTDKDIIRVLEDSTHDNNSTYYRWNSATSQFDFVGEIESGSSINVVQTTGASTADVMSQNAVTSMVFADPGTNHKIRIGNTASTGIASTIIGYQASGAGGHATAIGDSAISNGAYGASLGTLARAGSNYSVALGSYSHPERRGEVNIGTGGNNLGYDNTDYRVLGGVHDPVADHDAATKGYVDNLVGDIESALNIINNGGNS